MLAFHGKQELKDMYIARLAAHRADGTLVQGEAWDGIGGCAVGCTVQGYDHEQYPSTVGLPIWAANLKEMVFEALPHSEAMLWPEQFMSAIPAGADTRAIESKLALYYIKHATEILCRIGEMPISQEFAAAIHDGADALESAKIDGKQIDAVRARIAGIKQDNKYLRNVRQAAVDVLSAAYWTLSAHSTSYVWPHRALANLIMAKAFIMGAKGRDYYVHDKVRHESIRQYADDIIAILQNC